VVTRETMRKFVNDTINNMFNFFKMNLLKVALPDNVWGTMYGVSLQRITGRNDY